MNVNASSQRVAAHLGVAVQRKGTGPEIGMLVVRANIELVAAVELDEVEVVIEVLPTALQQVLAHVADFQLVRGVVADDRRLANVQRLIPCIVLDVDTVTGS